ncbi:ABC transporter ATP-binding protein [Bowmanella pacifica]|nr:ABC transporter ATP-binding protein [Bowmanella pacifica]
MPDSMPKSVLGFSRPYLPSKRAFSGLMALTLLATLFELGIPLIARELIDRLSIGRIDQLVMTILAIAVIVAAVAEYFAAVHASKMGLSTVQRLRFRLIGHLVNVQTIKLHDQHSSELAAQVMTDTDELKDIFSSDLAALIGGVLSFVAVIALLLWMKWRLTLVLLGCLLIGALLITPIALSMSSLNKQILQQHAELTRQCTEWFRHHELVKVYGATPQVEEQAQAALDRYYQLALREARALALIGPISNMMLMTSMIALIATSAYWIAEGTLSMGTFTAFLLYLFGLTFPLIGMGMFFANYQKANGAAERLHALANLPTENVQPGSAASRIRTLRVEEAGLQLGEQQILQNLTLPDMQRGLVLVSGASGSGKTSLLRTLLGLYPLTHGQIYINNQPLSLTQLGSWRHRMAWVEQEPALFQATVRDNLCLGKTQVDDAEVIQVLHKVGLAAWLERIGGNLDMLITEQNHQLSGGEKQRFALARALVRPFDMLLLDEPTSALDTKNAQQMMSTLTDLAQDKLVLMISHDHSLFSHADQIVQLENDKLVSIQPKHAHSA